MNRLSRNVRRFIQRLVVAWLLFAPAAWAAVDLYAPDKGHLWNRVYAGLIVRERKGVVYDDLLDPPYYAETTHLLSEASHTAALALLREFTGNAAVLREMSPLARAVMQRDLIVLVHWLSKAGKVKPSPEQEALARALVQAVRFVALTGEEIGKLPDNYAQAVAKSKVAVFDPKQPGRAFLPPDLLSEQGPWLSVEPTDPEDPLAAPMHSRSFSGRSVLEVRFRHADGREAGEKYLQQLAAMPLKIARADQARSTPQFPPGTMWALVRRAILPDAQGKLVASPLIESVQLRFYRKIELDYLGAQVGLEWELSRRLLLGDGGFHRTEGRDQFFAQFSVHFGDTDPDKIDVKSDLDLSAGQPALCMPCHLAPGVLSVNSHTRDFRIGDMRARPDLKTTTRARVAEVAVGLANQRSGWQFLRKLWDEK